MMTRFLHGIHVANGVLLIAIWGAAVAAIAVLRDRPIRADAHTVMYPMRVIRLDADADTVTVVGAAGADESRPLQADYFPVEGAGYTPCAGDRVFVGIRRTPDRMEEIFVASRVRETPFIVLTAVFLSMFVLVGGRRARAGLLALVAAPLGTLGLVRLLAGGVPPPLAAGGTALALAVLIAVILAGFRRATLAIILGAMAGLALTALLAEGVSRLLLLTGVHSSFTQDLWHAVRVAGMTLDLGALLRAGILFGALGVVIDLAMGVASSVFEVSEVNPALPARRLIASGMRVGRDVMSTEINTLVFAYTGSQIGLMLLPYFGPQGYALPVLQILSLQDFATEVASVTVGTAGLILTIPFTAIAAGCLAATSRREPARPAPAARLLRRDLLVSLGWCCVWTALCVAGAVAYSGRWHAYGDVGYGAADSRLVRVKVLTATPSVAELPSVRGGERAQAVEARVLTGPEAGRTLHLHNPISGFPGHDKLAQPGHRLLVKTMSDGAETIGAIIDYDRGSRLLAVGWALGALVILVGGRNGARALFALILCAPVLGVGVWGVVRYALPALPVLAGVALVLCLMVFFILCGPSRKGLAAACGAFGGIVCGGATAALAGRVMRFSGVQSHSLYAIRMFGGGEANLDFQGLLAGGILLGIVGVAMDVAIAVASCAGEIAGAGGACRREIWTRGMNVGRNIMCTMVLALLFAYLGSNLALLLLPVVAYNMPIRLALNNEIFATEIVRIVAGAIGVVVAIPAAAIVASALFGHRTPGGGGMRYE